MLKVCKNNQDMLDGTQSKMRIGNYLSSRFPIENGLKQGDALSLLLFNFSLEYIRKVQGTNLGLDMIGDHKVLAYAEGGKFTIRTIERNTDVLLNACEDLV